MKKLFTVSATSGTANVEAVTKSEALAAVPGAYSAQGPRFTDSLRAKAPRKVDTDTLGRVYYLGTRQAVRALARL